MIKLPSRKLVAVPCYYNRLVDSKYTNLFIKSSWLLRCLKKLCVRILSSNNLPIEVLKKVDVHNKKHNKRRIFLTKSAFKMTSASSLTSTEIPPVTILHQSIVNRDLETIQKIIKEYKNWKATDDEGETVLHLAFKCKSQILFCQESVIQTLKCFLDQGMSVDMENAAGQTVLFLAVEHRLRCVVDFLLERGANLNVRDQNGNSIVHFLIEDQFKKYYENYIKNELISKPFLEQQHIVFMKWLLSKGVDVDVTNNDGKTAFNLAIERNLQHVMPALIKHMNVVDYIDENGCTIIESFFKAKMNSKQASTGSYIYNVCYNSRYDNEIVESFLEKGVSVDHVNKNGNTLVHEILKSYNQTPKIIRLMLQHYTNVNAQDRGGNTVLHILIKYIVLYFGQNKKLQMDGIRTLLSKNPNVHLENNIGETAVTLAVQVKHLEVLKALLQHSSNTSPSANSKVLVLHHISSVPSNEDQAWAPMVDALVRLGWDVNSVRRGDHFTPLMEACRSRCYAITQKLIDNGANVNYVESRNLLRPIHIVVSNCVKGDADMVALFKMLARAGAEVNARNKHGQTVLHLVPNCGYSIMRNLLDLGAHVDATDNARNLPLYEAIRKRDVGAIEALLEFGAEFSNEGILQKLNNLEPSQTSKYLTQHCLKLKALNLLAIDDLADFTNENSFQDFYFECLREVETLKTYHLNDWTTLYDLLHMDVHLKFVFIKQNEKLIELVNSLSFETDFPKYHILLSGCYNKAVARYPLIKPAKRAWHYLTGIELPDCVERILAYLENDDLRVMAEVEDEVNPLKRISPLTFDEPVKKVRLTQ